MSRLSFRALTGALLLMIFAQNLPAQYQGGLGLSLGFTPSEKPVISANYTHQIVPHRVYALGGFTFFHPGSQIAASEDPDKYFASATQFFAGVQLGDALYIAPRLSYNWYGPYRSVGWGISGGFSIQLTKKLSLGLGAAHDRLRFDNSVDAYGPSPFTSVFLAGRVWIFPGKR
jgi:hypothetical protein